MKEREFVMITAKPISPALGAEISGFDCNESLSEAIIHQLENYLRQYQLLLFRGQTLSKKQYLIFAKHFGRYGLTNNPYKDKRYSQISIVSNIKKDEKNIGLISKENAFHSDGYDYSRLFRRILLYSKIAPQQGGGTSFANMRLAYNQLPTELKKEVQGKYIIYEHIKEAGTNLCRPVVIKDSITKQKALRVIQIYSLGVKGKDKKQSEQWIAKFYQHIISQNHVYQHQWQAGDIVLWDNISLLHAADKAPKEDRLLWRILLY